MRPSVAAGRHRSPKVTPNGLRNRPGDVRKPTKDPCFDLGGALGALGASRATPPTPKMNENTLFSCSPNIRSSCAAVIRQERPAKIHDGFLPQDTGFKHWQCCCPPRAPAKKLAMVPSLQPALLKMAMAPPFLSSSNPRRHNNARPHPVYTLLSAAAERSSYGYSEMIAGTGA